MRTVRVIGNVEPGGGQLSALRLGVALERRGWSVHFLAGSATPGGVELFRSHGLELDVYGATRSLQYDCDEGFVSWLAPRLAEADLVHGHQFGAWWAAARAALPGVPVVGSEHNAYEWPAEPPLGGLRWAFDRLDRLFVHGPAAREQLLAMGADPALLHEGRSAIDSVEDVRPVPLPARRLVYAGRLHQEKGPDVLLEALALVGDRPPLYLVGSGPFEDDLRRRARRLGIEADVTFVGWSERPADWIAGARACVVPSRRDAWSQTAVLAMALAVPVVGTAVEGLTRVLSCGRGVAVAPEDPKALARALEHLLEGRVRTDLEGARGYAARFTSERVASLYEYSYAQLLAPVGSGSPTDPTEEMDHGVLQL